MRLIVKSTTCLIVGQCLTLSHINSQNENKTKSNANELQLEAHSDSDCNDYAISLRSKNYDYVTETACNSSYFNLYQSHGDNDTSHHAIFNCKVVCSLLSNRLQGLYEKAKKRLSSSILALGLDVGTCGSAPMPFESSTEGYTLIQSQVVFRHGARTPIRLTPGIKEASYDRRSFQAILPHTDFDFDIVDLEDNPAVGFDKSPVNKRYESTLLKGGMLGGQLTSVGMTHCYNLGLDLRRRYIHKHKLLQNEFNAEDVYLRSTFIKRTLESLQGVVAGMFSAEHLRGLNTKPKFHIEYYTEESIYPNIGCCQCLKDICSHGVAHLNDTSSERAKLMAKLNQWVDFPEDHGWNIINVQDNIFTREAHGLPLPREFEHLYDGILRQAQLDFIQCITGTPSDRPMGLKLAVGPFNHTVLSRMDEALKGSTKVPKLCLYSSHDTMIMPLLLSLGCFDGNWPTYASSIAYELWKDNSSNKHFVKILFNQKELKVAGKPNVLLPYEEFREIVKPFTVDPGNFKYLCENARAGMDVPRIEYSTHGEGSKLDISEEDTEAKAGDTPVGM
ncbi:ACP6 [Bugula neritina]|uniref:ACP6 n=1 Tax=Bugula neritina TaxID=10212 RepID=A0A7J7KHD4_BUGNE|nr:ACP6 [Bugula neritina]